jgi:uncharacterized protein YaaQ
MKLIIAITRDEESEIIINALIQKEYRVTRIASTGGFLRRGMTTMMIGVEDENVDDVITTVRNNFTPDTEIGKRRTTIFVLNVDRFEQV